MAKLPDGRKPLPNEWFVDRANRMENMNMQRYAVMIDVDGDWMYVPENPKMFPNHPEPKLFNDLQDAELERDKWNTGIVVDYPSNVIRPMTQEERNRSKVRGLINGRK